MAYKGKTYYATEYERPAFSNLNGCYPELTKDNGNQAVVHNCPLGTIVANEKICYRTDRDQNVPRRCLCGNEDSFVIPDGCCVEVEPTPRETTGERRSCGGPCGDGNHADDYFWECRCQQRNGTENMQKKKVHFNDEVTVYDCDKAFRSLQPEDINDLCRCCRKCVQTGTGECVGRPVLMYEIPEPKMEDTSLYQNDYIKHEVLPKDLPPWHPIMKERWNRMQVPSLAETTYQADFRPPPISKKARNPVYLAPQKEKRDPCEKLSESFKSWKKTSEDDCHLERVHSEKCCLKHCGKCGTNFHVRPETDNRAEDSQNGQGDSSDSRPKFGLQEADKSIGSRYWWKRSCCTPGDSVEYDNVPAELVKSGHQEFTTSYEHDFPEPESIKRAKSLEECDTCNCLTKTSQKDTQPNLLCTKYPNQSLMTQRIGII